MIVGWDLNIIVKSILFDSHNFQKKGLSVFAMEWLVIPAFGMKTTTLDFLQEEEILLYIR